MAPLIYFSDDDDDLYVRSSSSSGAANNAQQATSSGAGNSTSYQTDRADPILPGESNREDYDPDSHSEPTPHSDPGSTTNLLGEIPAVDENLALQIVREDFSLYKRTGLIQSIWLMVQSSPELKTCYLITFVCCFIGGKLAMFRSPQPC